MTTKRLHPFERVFSEFGAWRKPHCFRQGGRWYRLDVPTKVFVAGRHSLTGTWLRDLNYSELGYDRGGRTTVAVDDLPARRAIARRAARHHGQRTA